MTTEQEKVIEKVNQLNERQLQILLLGMRYLNMHPKATTDEMKAVAVAEYAKGVRITAKELCDIYSAGKNEPVR